MPKQEKRASARQVRRITEEILAGAMEQPGVSDYLAVYNRHKSRIGKAEPYLAVVNATPGVVTTNNSTSEPE